MSTDDQNSNASSLAIENNRTVEIHYSLYDSDGQELESTQG